MTTCRRIVILTLALSPFAGAAAQQLPPAVGGPPAAARSTLPPAAAAPAPSAADPGNSPPTVPRPILHEWIARVQHDSAAWAQCLRGSVGEASGIVVVEVVEAVGQRIEDGSLHYGCPAGSIGSAHSFTPGAGESCAASAGERDAFYAGWEQVRVLVCPGPHLHWLVRPARPGTGPRIEALAPTRAHPPGGGERAG